MRFHSQAGHKAEIINLLLKSSLPIVSRVAVGSGAIAGLANLLQQIECGKKVLLLHQAAVAEPWAAAAGEALEDKGYLTSSLSLPDGEQAKSHEQLLRIWTKLQQLQFDRSDTLVAVGGGALTDIAGFAASTYLRGIKTVLVPTTLLAQVDAAIGGKTGINLPAGKNLAGSFNFPAAVVVDTSVLATLPQREIQSGLGEIIKYALIEQTVAEHSEYRSGPRSFYAVLRDLIEKDGFTVDNPALDAVITTCIKMKLAVVGKDPLEGDLRRCLNLGHTLGHAIEKVSKYDCSHGQAVAIGCVFAARLAVERGLFPETDLESLVELLEAAQLPVEIPAELAVDDLVAALSFDKKREAAAIKFVLPEKQIGRVDLNVRLSLDEIASVLKGAL